MSLLIFFASLTNLVLGAWLFCSLLWTLRTYLSQTFTLVFGLCIYLVGSIPGVPLGVIRWFLPNFRIFQDGFSAHLPAQDVLELLFVNGLYFLIWLSFLRFCRAAKK